MVSSIEQLAEHWQQGDLRRFLREFRTLRQNYAKTHAQLIESIVDMAWKRAVRDDDEHLLGELMRIGPAPALDPRWNRARMFLTRGHVNSEALAAFERYGMAYADDLARVESLPPAERPIAAALAYQQMARSLVTFGTEHVHRYRAVFRGGIPGTALARGGGAGLPQVHFELRAAGVGLPGVGTGTRQNGRARQGRDRAREVGQRDSRQL